MQRPKDYYKILEVQPAASQQDIKAAYRRLAFTYHPDKNDNTFAAAHFKEISEAYHILSHPSRRRLYDEERWLAGMGNRMRDKQVISAQWILDECRRLSAHMKTIDTYRMSHSSLRDYIMLLLSDSHMGILQQAADTSINEQIVIEILNATRRLQLPYLETISQRLAILAGDNEQVLNLIYSNLQARKKEATQQRSLPYIIIIITILLAILMYIYGK